jgi:aminopeptidase N
MTRPAALRRNLCLAASLTGLWIGIVVGDAAAQALPHHDLRVRLDPSARELLVDDTILIHQTGQIEFKLAPQFTVESILVDGAVVAATPRYTQGQQSRWRVPLGGSQQAHSIAVRYRGRLEPLPDADHRGVLHGLPLMADPDGSFLPGGARWYPEIGSGPFTYRLSLELPAGQRGLVPGRGRRPVPGDLRVRAPCGRD